MVLDVLDFSIVCYIQRTQSMPLGIIRSGCVLGLLLALAPVEIAHSQEGTEALGTPVGAFIFYPSLTVDTEYDDNIFATDGNEEDDIIFRIKPLVNIESDWDNHSLQFLSSATFNQFVDNTSEDVIDYEFLSSGRVDILEDTFLFVSAGVNRTHEDRTSPDDVQGEEPTQYTIIGGSLGFEHRFNRVWTEFDNTIQHLDFDDVDGGPGVTINNDDRDRLETTSRLRVGYDLNPDVSAFVQGSFGLENYDETPDDAGFDRDSYGYGVAVGMRFDITDLIIGDAFVGYQERKQDDDLFDDENTYNIGAGLTWFATELTTANLNASRGWEETTVAGSSAALTTNFNVTVNHSLTDTVTLSGLFNYTNEDFENTSRTDDTYSFGPEVNYLMNRFVHFSLGYNYQERDSDALGEDFKENRVMLTMRLQY